MGMQDFTYRLMAQSGDSTPHDEKAVSGDLSGGTIALVDLGSGDYAWSFTGRASVAVPSSVIESTTVTGGGMTMAIRCQISTYGADFTRYAGWCDTATETTSGLILAQTADNVVRLSVYSQAAGSGSNTSSTTVNAATRTYVIKQKANDGGAIKCLGWIDTTGALTAGGVVNITADLTIDTVWIGDNTTAGVIKVSDLVIWPEELTDQQCNDLAVNGIRTTLGAGGASTVPPGILTPSFFGFNPGFGR